MKASKILISDNYDTASSIFSKGLGLMFKSKHTKPLLMTFKRPQKISLHNFFVFFPIDILYLDNKFKIIELKQNFKPFTFYNPKKKANYVLELKKDTISKYNLKINDKIIFSLGKIYKA
jgi:uncharacterized protein